MKRTIPHISMDDFRGNDPQKRQAFIDTLGKGLMEFGFLTVSGHGLDQSNIEKVYQGFKSFFDLPETTKKQYDKVAGGARGYTPFGREHAKDRSLPDLKEFYHIGQELPEGHPYREEYQDNVWPQEIAGLQDATLKLYRGLETVAFDMLQALEQFFKLPEGSFSAMMKDGNSILRPIHYPPIDSSHPAGAVRAAAHEDINLITLLIESKGQGLQLLTAENEWLDVHALEGDIVVDSGDMLSRACNGVIPATTHRVINPPDDKNESRYSMPFFVHPYSACDLSVMDRFISEDRPAQWPPITAGAFLAQRLREIGLM